MFSIAPRRIFIDTCAFQAISDCGEFVFGEDPFPDPNAYASGSCPQVLKRSDRAEILHYLKKIFLFDQRAQFDWIVSPQSLNEVDASGDRSRSIYIRDIMDHSSICLAENPPDETAGSIVRELDDPSFGFLSQKDKLLLLDAAAAGCDTFLTIEKRLPRMADTLLQKIPFVIATPASLWAVLEPHLSGL